MCVNTKQVYIGYYGPGSVIQIPVEFVKNHGPGIVIGLKVTVTYDEDDLTFSSFAGDQGSYNDLTKEWTIGTVIKGQSVAAYFDFIVEDDCPSVFSLTFEATTINGCDVCLDDNDLCISTYGVSCCDIRSCVDSKLETVTIASYDIDLSDNILQANASANVVQFNLPTAADAYNTVSKRGKSFTVKVVDFTNGVSVVADGSEKILDGTNLAGASSTYSFAAVGEFATFTSNGTYYIVT